MFDWFKRKKVPNCGLQLEEKQILPLEAIELVRTACKKTLELKKVNPNSTDERIIDYIISTWIKNLTKDLKD